MKYIIHRVNTIKELETIPSEYGVEIDIRAYNQDLILNHEPFETGDKLEDYLKASEGQFMVFNIKEAGIEQRVIDLAEEYGVKNYFLLDVEFPFIYKSIHTTNFRNIAMRYSEAEPIEFALAQTDIHGKSKLDWLWIDTNSKLPLNNEIYEKIKQAGYKTCLVCPERWGRPEDIEKYKSFLRENNIELDAVMTAEKYLQRWK